MNSRFAGAEGQRALLGALGDQWLVNGDAGLARALAAVGKVEEYPAGGTLINQGADDRSIILLLAGEVAILVNGREVATRRARQHVGEMAMIDLTARRSASVVARSSVSVLRLGEPEFADAATRHPDLWRRLAVELCQRLLQRNDLVRRKNEPPVMFIGSSREGRAIATAIQAGLEHDPVHVRVWTDGIFGPSGIPIDDLLGQVDGADFATLVVSPDDEIVSRGVALPAPRDNVVFELGLFMGALGRRRTFMLQPRGVDLKLPTDLLGVTPITYEPGRIADLASCMGTACTQLRDQIRLQGSR